MESLLTVGNLLSLVLLWLIVALAYRSLERAFQHALPESSPTEDLRFADLAPNEEFWVVPSEGSLLASPAQGAPVRDGLLLGRGPSCGLRIDDPFVSETHLRVSGGSRACLVEDLGSANGYAVEEQSRRGETVLKEGQWFSLGETTFRIERRPK